MRRRDFIKVIAVSAAAWPLAARAQKSSSVRRVSVLMSTASDDSLGQAHSAAFAQGLQQLGWEIGSNIRIDYRWGSGNTERFRKYAAELVGLSPDVMLGTAASIVRALQEASQTIPIVFVTTIDPVGSGLVASLSHPGGNASGFIAFEFSLSAKLLELLKEIAPGVNRVAVLRDPTVPAGSGGFAAIQTAAPSFGVELTAIDVQSADAIERGITEFARPQWRIAYRRSDVIDDAATRPGRYSRGQIPSARGLPLVRLRRRPPRLWGKLDRSVPPRCWLCRSHPQGRAAGQSAGASTDKV